MKPPIFTMKMCQTGRFDPKAGLEHVISRRNDEKIFNLERGFTLA